MEISDFISRLDAKRLERGMSYQAVADACGVSKATIYRTLTGATEPTAQLLSRIEAAVQYVPPVEEPLPPPQCSDAYVDYLRAALRQQAQDYNRHITQLQTHYSMLHRQDRRVINFLIVCVTVLVIFLILWLVMDAINPSIGWIHRWPVNEP